MGIKIKKTFSTYCYALPFNAWELVVSAASRHCNKKLDIPKEPPFPGVHINEISILHFMLTTPLITSNQYHQSRRNRREQIFEQERLHIITHRSHVSITMCRNNVNHSDSCLQVGRASDTQMLSFIEGFTNFNGVEVNRACAHIYSLTQLQIITCTCNCRVHHRTNQCSIRTRLLFQKCQ